MACLRLAIILSLVTGLVKHMVSKFCKTNNFTFCLVTNLIDKSFSSLGPWDPYPLSLSADIGIQNISSRSRTCIQLQHIILWFHSSPYFRGQSRYGLGLWSDTIVDSGRATLVTIWLELTFVFLFVRRYSHGITWHWPSCEFFVSKGQGKGPITYIRRLFIFRLSWCSALLYLLRHYSPSHSFFLPSNSLHSCNPVVGIIAVSLWLIPQGPVYVLHSNVILRFSTRKMTNFGNLGLRIEQGLLRIDRYVYIQQATNLKWIVKLGINWWSVAIHDPRWCKLTTRFWVGIDVGSAWAEL